MARRAKTMRRVAIHGSAEERQAAFERLLAENAQSLCYRYVENGDGTSTVTTTGTGKSPRASRTRPSTCGQRSGRRHHGSSTTSSVSHGATVDEVVADIMEKVAGLFPYSDKCGVVELGVRADIPARKAIGVFSRSDPPLAWLMLLCTFAMTAAAGAVLWVVTGMPALW